MNHKILSSAVLLSLSLIALTTGGCEVSVSTGSGFRDGGFDFDDRDSGTGGDPTGNNGSMGDDEDGGGSADDDAATETGDDASVPGADWTLREYCEASFKRRLDWQDWLDACCTSRALGSAEGEAWIATIGATDDLISGCESSLQALVDDGEVTFDPSKVDACLAEQKGGGIPEPPADCTGIPAAQIDVSGHDALPLKHLPACAAAFAPSLEIGDECGSSLACPEGARCLESNVPDRRTCQQDVPVGGSCATTLDCESGLYFVGVFGAGTRACSENLGAATTRCSATNECENGLFCHAVDGRCATPRNAGEDCDEDADCAVDLFCGSSDTCEAYPAAGQSCDAADSCAGYCDLENDTCESLCGG